MAMGSLTQLLNSAIPWGRQIPDAILHASGRTKVEFSSAWGEAAVKEEPDEREECSVANNPL